MQWKTIEPTKLNELIQANTPIYILNTSNYTNGRMAIIISFIDGTRRRQFTVPPTFIPMCITDAIPHKEVSNPDFLDLLNKRIITLVDAKQAQDYLKTPEAVEEFHAIVLSEHSSKAQGINLEMGVKKSFSSAAALTAEVEEAVSDIAVSAKVRAFMDDLAVGTITAKQALSECKRHADSFTDLDLHYIRENSKDLELAKWVEGKLMDKSSDIGSTFKQPKKAVAKPSALNRAMASKKTAKLPKLNDEDAPANAEEEAELARGMAMAQSRQAISGRIPDSEFIKLMNK